MPGKSRPQSNEPGAGARSAASRRGITSSDRLLRELVAGGDVLPWDWDLEIDRFRWAASPAWLLGVQGPVEHGYADLRELVHPDDRARFIAATDAAKNHCGAFALECRIVTSGNTATRSVLVRGHSQSKTGTVPTRLSGIVVALGVRATAANADTLQQHQLALLDSLPDVAWLKDIRGYLVSVNLAFSKRYGIKREAAIGKTDFDIYPRDKAAQLRREDNEVIASRLPIRYESSMEFEGKRCWVEIVKSPSSMRPAMSSAPSALRATFPRARWPKTSCSNRNGAFACSPKCPRTGTGSRTRSFVSPASPAGRTICSTSSR